MSLDGLMHDVGDQDSCMERLGRPEDRLGRLEGGGGPLLPPSRPRSQLSNTGKRSRKKKFFF